MQKLPPLLLHQKKREKEGARGLGIELLESKKDKKDEINRIREKKKTKKGILPPSPPPASPSSSPTFIPCTVSCILNLPICHPTALASSSHAN
jgi:hypothetical protein